MTQKDKELLLKDLCARLPYYVKVEYKGEEYEVLGIAHGRLVLCKPFMSYTLNEHPLVEEIKPYLFPLSSMTEEQYDEFEKIVSDDYLENIQITKEMRERVDFITHFPIYCPNVIDWLNKNHFDYRGLIEKGLAIDATGLNIY